MIQPQLEQHMQRHDVVSAMAPARSMLLQRKCACGGTPGPSGECEECHQRRQGTLQRTAVDRSLTGSSVLPIVHDVLRTSGQPLDTRASTETRFGHDFSHIRVHPESNASPTVQPKLRLNQADDPYEREADQVSSEIMQLQKSLGGSFEQGHPVRPSVRGRVMEDDAGPVEAPALVDDVLHSSGQPLDPPTRGFFENRFGHEFGGVRVHNDARAAESAQAINALAYTVGRDVVFAAGKYAPSTLDGKQLLAHELTHVIQQGNTQGIPPAQPKLVQRSLGTYVKAMNQDPPDWYTAALHLNGESPKIIRQMLKNLGDPQRIAKLHNAARDGAGLGRCSNVALLTEPDYLKLNPGEKPTDRAKCEKPSSAESQKSDSQPRPQAGGAIDPLKRSASEIMADDKYIDNNITRMEYYAAQEAHIFYNDGSKLELGLVPPYVKEPFEGVDYRTPRTTHISVASDEPGTFKYMPRGTEIQPPAGMKYGEVLEKFTQTVTFKVEPGGKRIVPTQVNTRTAPVLCQMLMESEKEYEKLMQATSEGGVKVFESMQRVLLIYSLLPAGGLGARAMAARGAGAAGTKAGVDVAAAESSILQKLLNLLKTGGAESFVVEGVQFAEIRVALKGTELAVRRFGIRRLTAAAGEGRIVHAAFERAAIEAAKQNGAKTVRIMMETPVNPVWKAYLESQGYTMQLYEKVGEVGFTNLLTKVFTI